MYGKYEINYLNVQTNLFLIKNWNSVKLQNYLDFFRDVLTVSGRKTYEEVSSVTRGMSHRAERGSKRAHLVQSCVSNWMTISIS